MDAEIRNGVFFNLSDEAYHAIPALSATGVKNLLVSQMDFWARCRWLNPLYEEEVDSEARMIGKAYHKRILEGKAAFDACYAPKFAAPADCLETIDDIKAALAQAGIEAKGKRNKAELIEFARDNLPHALIYEVEERKYQEEHAGKTFLSQKLLDKIEIAAAMIEKHPHLSKCFTGGYPEVSVIWEEDGIRMKARFDYLKPKAIIDLKTFANQMNKPIDRAIYGAMASGKYYVQAAFYLNAVSKAQELIKGSGDLAATPKAWLNEFLTCEEHGFYLIFQQKGVAPLARGKKFPRGMVYGAGIAAIEDAKRIYRECLAKFGSDPWLDLSPIEDFRDDEFPAYTTEI